MITPPYIKYLETLIIGRLSPPNILRKFDEEIPLEIDLDTIQIVYNKLLEVYPEHFETRGAVSMGILEEIGIKGMYGYEFKVDVPGGTPGIAGAFNVLNDPLMYRLITALAIAKITEEDIEMVVNGKFNMSYSVEDIEQFLHYFFSVTDWPLKQKRVLLTTVKDPGLMAAYKLALKGDKDYLIWKLGASPDKSFQDMLTDMASDAYYNFKEISRADPNVAQRWGTLAIKLVDRIDKLSTETVDKQSLFDALTFKIQVSGGKDIKIRHISELKDDEDDDDRD